MFFFFSLTVLLANLFGDVTGAAYQLPDGHDTVLRSVLQTTFSCDSRRYGFYADVANQCQVFHVCVPILNQFGSTIETAQYSFVCGNRTIFDQQSLHCAHEAEAFPCEQSETLYDFVNTRIGEIVDGEFRNFRDENFIENTNAGLGKEIFSSGKNFARNFEDLSVPNSNSDFVDSQTYTIEEEPVIFSVDAVANQAFVEGVRVDNDQEIATVTDYIKDQDVTLQENENINDDFDGVLSEDFETSTDSKASNSEVLESGDFIYS